MTTAADAWAQAMAFANRADPYPFFAELRKSPVARVADDLYVVTGRCPTIRGSVRSSGAVRSAGRGRPTTCSRPMTSPPTARSPA